MIFLHYRKTMSPWLFKPFVQLKRMQGKGCEPQNTSKMVISKGILSLKVYMISIPRLTLQLLVPQMLLLFQNLLLKMKRKKRMSLLSQELFQRLKNHTTNLKGHVIFDTNYINPKLSRYLQSYQSYEKLYWLCNLNFLGGYK
jgi:hypothetical protein